DLSMCTAKTGARPASRAHEAAGQCSARAATAAAAWNACRHVTAGKTAVHAAGGTHLYIDGADCRGSASFGVNPTAGPVTNRRIMRETRGLMPRPAGHVTVQAMSEGPQGISPVTEVFTWRVSQGKQGEFESWAHGIGRKVRRAPRGSLAPIGGRREPLSHRRTVHQRLSPRQMA